MPQARAAIALIGIVTLLSTSTTQAVPVSPQASGHGPYTIEQVLAPGYPVELAAAADVGSDRLDCI